MWLPGQLSALGSWPKASRPRVMVQPATVGKLINFYLKSGSEGGYISSCDFWTLELGHDPSKDALLCWGDEGLRHEEKPGAEKRRINCGPI